MGRFINYVPSNKDVEIATELQPETRKIKLISPQEWTYCEKEKELIEFAKRNTE
ncbi:hypothetical protein JCM14036_23030 [Desulfotomaculum defluvii]